MRANRSKTQKHSIVDKASYPCQINTRGRKEFHENKNYTWRQKKKQFISVEIFGTEEAMYV